MKLFEYIYWKLYPCINTKVVYLQRYIDGFSLTDDVVRTKYNLNIKIVDYDSDDDLQNWCDVINNSYDDCYYDIAKARHFLKHHPIFDNVKTVLFYDYLKCCATVSWGGVISRPKVGGDFRIGVHNEYKGRGLGKMLIEYAFSQLSKEGYKLGESIITIKRSQSLYLHFSLGFLPRYNVKYVSYKDNLKYINLIQRIRLTIKLFLAYKSYKNRIKHSFV